MPPYPRSARKDPPVARHVPISRSAFVRTILAELSELEPSAVSAYKCAARVSEFERRLQHVDKLRTSGFTRASVICLFEQPAEVSDVPEFIHRRGFMLARVFGMREAADQ